MFLALWYYLQGYVMIEVSGFSVERFVNMATHRGIYLWDVIFSKTKVMMKVSRKAYEELEICGEKTGCRYEILGEYGLPVALRRCGKRKILAGGILFFVFSMYGLSSFVWTLDIKGNERIETSALVESCKSLGVYPGAWKMQVKTKEITEALITDFPEIAWVSVKIEGTKAIVKLVETIQKTEIVEQDTPKQIVAAKNGIITEIAAERGTPLVVAGAVVEKGDILIDSKIRIGIGEEIIEEKQVHACGKVRAKLWYALKEEVPLVYTEKIPKEERKKDATLVIKDTGINFFHPHFGDDTYSLEKKENKLLSIGDFKLPLAWVTTYYRRYEEVEQVRTQDEAKVFLEEVIRKKANDLLAEEGELVDIQIVFGEYQDKVTAEATVTVVERIDHEQDYKEENAENESINNDN